MRSSYSSWGMCHSGLWFCRYIPEQPLEGDVKVALFPGNIARTVPRRVAQSWLCLAELKTHIAWTSRVDGVPEASPLPLVVSETTFDAVVSDTSAEPTDEELSFSSMVGYEHGLSKAGRKQRALMRPFRTGDDLLLVPMLVDPSTHDPARIARIINDAYAAEVGLLVSMVSARSDEVLEIMRETAGEITAMDYNVVADAAAILEAFGLVLNGKHTLCTMLFSGGAYMREDPGSALTANDEKVVSELLKEPVMERALDMGDTPLVMYLLGRVTPPADMVGRAIRSGNADMVRELLLNGATPSSTDVDEAKEAGMTQLIPTIRNNIEQPPRSFRPRG